MTTPAQTSADPGVQAPVGASAVSRVLRAIGMMKSVSDADMKDIEQIVSVVDDHVEPHTMPTATEVPTGPGQAMRGGQAPTQVAMHSNLMPQQGITEMYEMFDKRMGALQKALGKDIVSLRDVVKGIVDNLAAVVKAAEEEKDDMNKTYEEKDSGEKMTKAAKAEVKKATETALAAALRKARTAVAKADDEEDDDDEMAEVMDKANTAIEALKAVIAKAEDDMEDDEDEKRAEKARTDLRTLKAQLKKAVDTRAKKVAAKAAVPVVVTPTVISKDDIDAALTEWATKKGISVADVFAKFGGPAASPMREVPTFAKAYGDGAVLTMDAIDQRIEDASEGGFLKDADLNLADSLKSRLSAVRAGRFDAEAFVNQVKLAPVAVQSIFALPKAA